MVVNLFCVGCVWMLGEPWVLRAFMQPSCLFVISRLVWFPWQPPSVRCSAAFSQTSHSLLNELGWGKSYYHSLTSYCNTQTHMNMQQNLSGPQESKYQWTGHNGGYSLSVCTFWQPHCSVSTHWNRRVCVCLQLHMLTAFSCICLPQQYVFRYMYLHSTCTDKLLLLACLLYLCSHSRVHLLKHTHTHAHTLMHTCVLKQQPRGEISVMGWLCWVNSLQ